MLESFSTFSAIVASIFIEAMPFLAVGALLSAVIEVFVSPDRLIRYLPNGIAARISVGVAAGLILPTCECGVVPIVRRLISKGVPVPTAVAFMLSAPVINPVVLTSTYVAFRGDPPMVVGRVLMVALIAAAVALIAARMGNILLGKDAPGDDPHESDHHGHAHGDTGHDSHLQTGSGAGIKRTGEVLLHGAHEFIDMGKYLILGAIVAGLFKTYLPQNILLFFTGQPTLEIVGMMSLAVLLSVCSEADAFVAASFVSFSAASKVAFVAIGPMIDLKLIGMYAATFKRQFFWVLMIVPILLVLGLSMLFEVVV
jgi:uncharacterized membrane protein YraQ (UPF0718 family)